MSTRDSHSRHAAAIAQALLDYGLAECWRCTRVVPLLHLQSDKTHGGALRCRDVADCEHSRAIAISYGRIEEQAVRRGVSARRQRPEITDIAAARPELLVTD